MRRSRRLPCFAVLALLGCLPLSSTGIPIDGRVRDSGGAGLAGVRVELRPILSSYEMGLRELDGREVEPAARTVTDADGRFELLAPGEGMWEVGVSAEGYVPQRFRLTPLTAAETLFPVRLRRDAGLRVRVEGPDGRPLAGARVLARRWRQDVLGWEPAPRIATSGADGVARVPGSRDESLLLLATAPGFPVQEGPEARGPGEITFRLAAGTSRTVEAPEGAIVRDLQTSLVLGRVRSGSVEVVTLGESWLFLETADGTQARFVIPAKGGAVRVEAPASSVLPGNVIDSEARQPVAGAWVWRRDDPGRFARTDGQGAYRMEIAGWPYVSLEVAAAGLLPETVDREIPWPEGGLPTVALDPEALVSGTVEDEDGNPAAGAEVTVFQREELWFFRATSRPPRVGRVSAQGKVRIAGLRQGSGAELVVTGSGFAPAWLKEGWLPARDNRFMVILSRGGRVQGRIEDGQGRPVPEAEVAIEPGASFERIWNIPDPADEEERLTVTATDGGFAFADLPAGWYDLIVRRPGAAEQRLPRIEVKGGAADLGALRLDDAEVLTARVIDTEGRPVAAAEVWVSELFGQADTSDWPAAVSGADGGFTLRASRWQSLEMTVCGPGFVPLGMRLGRFLPDEPLVITVQRGATVSGRITGPDGFPVAGQVIPANLVGSPEPPLSHECEGQGWNMTDVAGRYRLTGLEPGLHSVYWDNRLVLAAGDSREVNATTGAEEVRSASFSGKLLGSGGVPVPGALITLSAYEDHENYMTQNTARSRSDADGSYRLSFDKPGLRIDGSSLGIVRHGRTLIQGGFSSWPGPAAVEADGRLDIAVKNFPLPLAREAPIPLKDQRSAPGPVAAIAGRILGLEPAELARVKVSAALASGYSLWTYGTVDAQGSYRIEGLPPDAWSIRAEAADRMVFDSIDLPEGEARITRDLVFPPLGEVAGSIETSGSEREPVAGATVRLRHHAEPLHMQWPDIEVRTGSDGELRVRLPEGVYEVTASKEGFVPASEAPRDHAAVAENNVDHVSLWLRPAVELRGRLRGLPPDEDEVKIEATLVDGQPGTKKPLPGKMVAEGRYVIPGLAPGTWEVEAVYEVFGSGKRKATGRVVIPEEATEAALDLAFGK